MTADRRQDGREIDGSGATGRGQDDRKRAAATKPQRMSKGAEGSAPDRRGKGKFNG